MHLTLCCLTQILVYTELFTRAKSSVSHSKYFLMSVKFFTVFQNSTVNICSVWASSFTKIEHESENKREIVPQLFFFPDSFCCPLFVIHLFKAKGRLNVWKLLPFEQKLCIGCKRRIFVVSDQSNYIYNDVQYFKFSRKTA